MRSLHLILISFFLVILAAVSSASAFAFSVFDDAGLDRLSLESDKNLMTHIMNATRSADKYAFDEAVKLSGYSPDVFSELLKGESSYLASRDATYVEFETAISFARGLYDGLKNHYRSLSSAQVKAASLLWSVDGKEATNSGDLVLEIRRLYCLLAGENVKYASDEEDKGFSCSEIGGVNYPYPSDIKNLRDLIDKVAGVSIQVYKDTKEGYGKQTNELFDPGMCHDYVAKQKNTGVESFAVKTKATVGKSDSSEAESPTEIIPIEEHFSLFAEKYENNFRKDYSFSGIYSSIEKLERQYVGDTTSVIVSDESVRNDDSVTKKITSGYRNGEAVSFLASDEALAAHFRQVNDSLDFAEKAAFNTLPWTVKSAIKKIYLDGSLNSLREIMNAISVESAAMERIAFNIGNKQACQ